MPQVTGSDLAAALGLALLIIAFALCAWPGYARARAADIEGVWASRSGAVFRIRGRPDSSSRAITVFSPGRASDGELSGLRTVRVGGAQGYVAINGDIVWRAVGPQPADVWHRQGVKRRPS